MKKTLLGFLSLFLLTGAVMAPMALAQTPADTAAAPVDADYSPTVNNLVNASEAVNFVLILVAAAIMMSVITSYGKEAQMSGVFGFFLAGAVALGLSRFMLLLAGLNVISLEDHSLELLWHLVFYISMITFFLGGRMIVGIANDENKTASFQKTFGWDAFLAVYIIVVLVAIQSFNTQFEALYAGSFLDHLGFIHLIALLSGAFAAFYLFQRARIGKITSVLATPILLAFLFLAGEHLWEMMHESWGMFPLHPENFGDMVEEFFVLPSSILIIVAFVRLKKLIANPKPATV